MKIEDEIRKFVLDGGDLSGFKLSPQEDRFLRRIKRSGSQTVTDIKHFFDLDSSQACRILRSLYNKGYLDFFETRRGELMTTRHYSVKEIA